MGRTDAQRGAGLVDGDPAAQWRLLGGLWALGGALALLAALAGLAPEARPDWVVAVGLASILAGALVAGAARALPAGWIGAVLVAGTTAVSAATVAAGSAGSPFVLFYAWVGAEAWYFLGYRGAVAYTTYAIVLSGIVTALVGSPHGDATSWWLLMVGSLLAISTMSAALRLRADRLVARLAELASRDELTGALNRRGLHALLGTEIARAARYGGTLSVVLCDLDGFKALNDRDGHAAGDEALRTFCRTCAAVLRGVDAVGRLGGDELCLVLPSTDGAAAVEAAGRVREALARAGGPTASFGVAESVWGDDVEALLRRADAATYAAKAAGRDRIVAA